MAFTRISQWEATTLKITDKGRVHVAGSGTPEYSKNRADNGGHRRTLLAILLVHLVLVVLLLTHNEAVKRPIIGDQAGARAITMLAIDGIAPQERPSAAATEDIAQPEKTEISPDRQPDASDADATAEWRAVRIIAPAARMLVPIATTEQTAMPVAEAGSGGGTDFDPYAGASPHRTADSTAALSSITQVQSHCSSRDAMRNHSPQDSSTTTKPERREEQCP
jgi:hypothetical protein